MRISRGLIAQAVAALVFAASLALQVVRIGPRASLSKRLAGVTRARAAGDVDGTLESAKAALELAPNDTRLQLLHAHSLFAADRFDEATGAYKEIAAASEIEAAALTGRAAALVARRSPPRDEDVENALKLLGKARKLAPELPDVAAVRAVAEAWAGDEAGVKEALAEIDRLEGRGKPPGLDAAVARHCVRALECVRRGDIDDAIFEAGRAAWIMPARATALGAYVGRSLDYLELEAAARAGASGKLPEKLRQKMLRRLKAEGARGLADPKTYPVFLRASAAAACGDRNMRPTGLALLDRAIEQHKGDPVPVIAKIRAYAAGHVESWKQAGAGQLASGSAGARLSAGNERTLPLRVSLYDALPGADLPRPGVPSSVNRSLAAIEKAEGPLLKEIVRAAERAAALKDEAGSALALSLIRLLYTWKMRQAELSTDLGRRRERESKALESIALAEKLLGTPLPPGEVSAVLYRNAGVVLAGRFETDRALAAFRKSLEIRPDQEDLAKLLSPESESLRLVATYPDPSRLYPAPPPVGAEFRLPVGVRSLADCTFKATLGPRREGGEGQAKRIEPRVTRTGLWYLPETGELSDGDMEARFTVTDALGRTTEAVARFRVDKTPPVIVERFPAPGATLEEKHPLVRVRWKDLSGVNPDTVGLTLDPVTAEFFRQTLVQDGRQRTSHFTEPKWRRGDPALRGATETTGEIVAAAMSELPVGSYKLTLVLEDNYRHAAEYAWEFTIQ